MTVVEILTGKPSFECYSESILSLNFERIRERLSEIKENYSQTLATLVRGMIVFDIKERLSLR